MAIDIRDNGNIGCACYVAGEERLLCMEEIAGGGSDVVEKRENAAAVLCSKLKYYSEVGSSANHGHPLSSLKHHR